MSTKEKISLLVLIFLYLLFTVRYFPGRPMDTLSATLSHLLDSVPYVIAATVLVVSIIQKVMGQKMPKKSIARIYLTFGLLAEFFFGLYHYLERGQL